MNSIAARAVTFDRSLLGFTKPGGSPRFVAVPIAVDIPAATTQMHPNVYKIALAVWAAFLAVFWITFWSSSSTLFMVAIDTFYAAMFFGVPLVMLRQTPERMKAQNSFQAFLNKPFAIIDGSISGFEALLQVIMVPACLTLGGIAIGCIIHAAQASS